MLPHSPDSMSTSPIILSTHSTSGPLSHPLSGPVSSAITSSLCLLSSRPYISINSACCLPLTQSPRSLYHPLLQPSSGMNSLSAGCSALSSCYLRCTPSSVPFAGCSLLYLSLNLHYVLLAAADCRQSLAPSSLFFLKAYFAFFMKFWLSFIDLADYRAILLDAIFISIRVSSMVGACFFGCSLPIDVVQKYKLIQKVISHQIVQQFLMPDQLYLIEFMTKIIRLISYFQEIQKYNQLKEN